MILYRYMTMDAVLGTVRSQLWRLGRVNDFNDPFDCLFALNNRNVSISEEEYAKFSAQFRKSHFSKYGILCFSSVATQPSMWAHYADRGRGVCVECELDDDINAYEMDYADERLVLDISVESYLDSPECKEHVIRIISRKHSSWSYERENRLIVDLADHRVLRRSTRGGAHGETSFHHVPIEIARIRRIIVGPYAGDGAEGLIRAALLKRSQQSVQVVRAKIHSREFSVGP